jgi:hypothetical protein
MTLERLEKIGEEIGATETEYFALLFEERGA